MKSNTGIKTKSMFFFFFFVTMLSMLFTIIKLQRMFFELLLCISLISTSTLNLYNCGKNFFRCGLIVVVAILYILVDFKFIHYAVAGFSIVRSCHMLYCFITIFFSITLCSTLVIISSPDEKIQTARRTCSRKASNQQKEF